MKVFGLFGLALFCSLSANAGKFVPVAPDLSGIVTDAGLVAKIGKAGFWDMQVGSDKQSCGSCHFHAGVDIRTTNVLSPGLFDVTVPQSAEGGDGKFGSTRSDTGAVQTGGLPSTRPAGAGVKLSPGDFPQHMLSNALDRNSAIISTTNDRVSSQGTFGGVFGRVHPSRGDDTCAPAKEGVFVANGISTRKVEPRHTPTMINTVFFPALFWDGRAKDTFNGVDPFGMRSVTAEPTKRLMVRQADGSYALEFLKMENAAFASLAVGPPLSRFEMSCNGRTFADVGRRLLGRKPLALQQVHKQDSLLAGLRANSGRGLRDEYKDYIRQAFDAKYWGAPGRYRILDNRNGTSSLIEDLNGYTQEELNFSMFWGVSLMMYAHTLVSDQSEFDTLLASGDLATNGLFAGAGATCLSPTGRADPLLVQGCTQFARTQGALGADGIRGGGCVTCHNSSVNQDANDPIVMAVGARFEGKPFQLISDGGATGGGARLQGDQGWRVTGTRNSFVDPFIAGNDPYGQPLSLAVQLRNYLANGKDKKFLLDFNLQRAVEAGGQFPVGAFDTLAPGRLGVAGASKVPILRSVALTPPYFSHGGESNLRQVIQFYNRGGNRRDIAPNPARENAAGVNCLTGDTSGTGPLGIGVYPLTGVTDCSSNTGASVRVLNFLDCEDPAQLGACTVAGKTVATDDIAAMVRFLQSLTDPRIQCSAAPFDQPSINIPIVQTGNGEVRVRIPASGALGFKQSSGLCTPNAGDLFAPGMQARLLGKQLRDTDPDDAGNTEDD